MILTDGGTRPSRTWIGERLTVTGAVQGVGFRPFVHGLARELGLDGRVRNVPRGVEILVAGPPAVLDAFREALLERAPPAAVLEGLERAPAAPPFPAGFAIEASDEHARESRLSIPPDLATCPACLAELVDPTNRRHRHPFLNCTRCGPRYSIAVGLPYDRATTTMAAFRMCPACRAEYEDPTDRRFHAQPTACPDCGPELAWIEGGGRTTARRADALAAAAAALTAGRIVAVQGLGGFHLMARADDAAAVERLRTRKRRGAKPFAVMFADVDDLARRFGRRGLSAAERAALTSPAAPIVLLRGPRPEGLCSGVAPVGPDTGCLLAYTPLHHLLLADVGRPLVATSGNLSDEPLAHEPAEALERLAGLADAFLVHDRAIARPVDDSIVRVVDGLEQVLRRARGFAPLALCSDHLPGTGVDLALGAHQKATVALRVGRRITVSPHLGDLTTVPARVHHERSVGDLERLVGATPDRVVCDAHPDYASTQLAERRSAAPLRVQHHEAHVRGVAFEHGLVGDYAAAAWDGTGAGTDGTVWGGEFFRADDAGDLVRVARFEPFPLLGGERAAREPWRVALGLLHAAFGESVPEVLARVPRRMAAEHGAPAPELLLAAARLSPATSSVGRMFDAVAALLDLCGVNDFEAEAALALEAEAERGLDDPRVAPWTVELAPGDPSAVRLAPWLSGLARDLEAGLPRPLLAARFHATLVEALDRALPDRTLLLTGGCFQNRLLLELALLRLRRDGRRVEFARRVPTNDGGIAVGQLVAAARRPAEPLPSPT